MNRALEWVPLEFQSWVLLAISFLALAFFVQSTASKWKILQLAQPTVFKTTLGRRLKNLIVLGLGQKKLFKNSSAGWMHALIFWGFLILLFRAGYFFAIGFFPKQNFSITGLEWLEQGYSLLKDGAVLAVTLAVSFGLFRRLVIRPSRLTLSREGVVILVLILAIMLSDVLFDSAWLALNPSAGSWFSPLGMMMSSVLGQGEWVVQLHNLAYWTHVSCILLFLSILPRGKHLHIITALPNLFFSDLPAKGNRLTRIDFEDEAIETFGIVKALDFSWKSILDFYSCTECGRCDNFCPALNSGKPLSPKMYTVGIRDHIKQETPLLLNGQAGEGFALLGDVISDETLWSCTTCGACEEECPVGIEYVPKVIEMRRGLVLNEDRYPEELKASFKSLEVNSNPWGFGRDSREDWADGLDLKRWNKDDPSEYLYFVGCNGAFDKRGQKIARSVVELLTSAGVDFSILGREEGCTGDPARRAGNEYLFEMLASKNAETFQEMGIVKVVTHCPHCFNSLKNEYPEFGVHLEVIHHSELLEQLMKEGRLPENEGTGRVVFHDSCYLGRHNEIYDPPRAVISKNELVEIENQKERGTCCGAGGARFLMEETSGSPMSHQRLDELMQGKPDTIAVSCPFCVLMLEDAVKAKGLEGTVIVADVAELANKQ